MTTLIYETLWYGECSTCGWKTVAPNDADTCVNKVKTHLFALHREGGADVTITGVVHVREKGEPPGDPRTLPDGDRQLQAAAARRSGT
jgi:hypothetical protein